MGSPRGRRRSATICRPNAGDGRVGCSRLPFLRERPHPHDRRRRRARHRRRRRGRRHHRATSDKPAGIAAAGRRCARRAAALARPRRPRRPGGRRPSQGASRSTRPASAREAEKLFARHNSLEARVGESFSNWPNGTVAGLTQLSGLHPKSAAVQLNLGIARFWAGEGGAEDAWKSAASLEPDTAYARDGRQPAPPGLRAQPADLRPVDGGAGRRPQARRAGAARAARAPRADGHGSPIACSTASRCSGSASSGRPSASSRRPPGRRRTIRRRAWQRPSGCSTRPTRRRRSPGSGRSRATFPKAATVRFHLGLLLLWSGQVKEARRQLELVHDGRARLAARRRREPVPGRASQGAASSLWPVITVGGIF